MPDRRRDNGIGFFNIFFYSHYNINIFISNARSPSRLRFIKKFCCWTRTNTVLTMFDGLKNVDETVVPSKTKLLKTSMRYQFNEFFNHSTLHGVRYIAQSDRPLHERYKIEQTSACSHKMFRKRLLELPPTSQKGYSHSNRVVISRDRDLKHFYLFILFWWGKVRRFDIRWRQSHHRQSPQSFGIYKTLHQ